jgi:hypothetical protein
MTATTTNYTKIAAQLENVRLVEKAAANGAKINTFDGWKAAGRFVKRGEKSRAYRVNAGVVRVGINPISGEGRYEAKMVTVYAFHIDQTAAY